MNSKHSIRLKRDFYNRPTTIVARQLLGKYLCRRIGNKTVKVRITETEAYCGVRDLACHASKGLTPRTKVMFGPPGHAYVYMIYGMYYCLNVVTEKEGNPSAVLIRSCEIIDGLPRSELSTFNFAAKPQSKVLLRGPGKLCRELKIDKKLNGIDLCKSKELWVENNDEVVKNIKKGKRIGVDYAGKWKDKFWRFYV